MDARFTADDMSTIADHVAERWTAGADRDWSVPAGTLEWSCTATADHAVDCVFAPATFLASRRTDRDMPIFTAGPDATVVQLVESLGVMTRILVDVVASADPDEQAVLFAGGSAITGRPADFLPRGGLELVLHAHDVCAGLGIAYEPAADVCRRLRDHTADWTMWRVAFGAELPRTDDPWADLLAASGRARC
jgi:hypothetical protein